MTKENFYKLLEEKPFILDGATGSNLLKMGMPHGVCTESWILEHPEPFIQLQKDYIASGSQAIYAPTFRANKISFADLNVDLDVFNTIQELVDISKKASNNQAFIAGDMGTTGKFPVPFGPLSYEELLENYEEQLSALAHANVDLIVAETLMVPEEGLAILDAAASVCPDLPILMSYNVESDGSLFFGGNIFDTALDLEAMGATAVGCNCSVGPDQLVAVISTLKNRLSIPIIAKPNAGMPEILPTGEARYDMNPSDFAMHMKALHEAGASILGGCCGTTPEYIKKLCNLL